MSMTCYRTVIARSIVAVIVLVCFCVPNASAKFKYKVGYIDLKRLVKESGMGKTALKEIEALRQEKEKEAVEKLQKIKQLQSGLNNDNVQLVEKRDKVKQLQTLNKNYKRFIADSKEEITQKDRELVSMILKNADEIIKTVAKKGGYSLIIKDPNVLGYLDPKIDITDDVLKKLNARRKDWNENQADYINLDVYISCRLHVDTAGLWSW